MKFYVLWKNTSGNRISNVTAADVPGGVLVVAELRIGNTPAISTEFIPGASVDATDPNNPPQLVDPSKKPAKTPKRRGRPPKSAT